MTISGIAKALALIIAVAPLLGCETRANYTDISDHPDFKQLVGKRYRLVEAMYIYGVNLPPGYGEEIQVYSIGPTNPGWGGRELITRDTLEEGTLLTVQSVKKCCFGMRKKAEVLIQPFETPVNVPISIRLEFLVDSYVEEF